MSEEIVYTDEKPSDANLNVEFYKTVNENGEELDYIRISIPGNAQTIIEEPVSEKHMARFRRQWDVFSGLREMKGTPIDNWDIPEPMKREFKKQEFNFVEQVANAPDALLQNIMGYQSWRLKARAFLDQNKVTPEKIINAQQAQIADLQAQIAELADLVTQPKRGRPVAHA